MDRPVYALETNLILPPRKSSIRRILLALTSAVGRRLLNHGRVCDYRARVDGRL